MRDFSQRQSQIFFLINTFLVRYEPPELEGLIDDDLSQAASALAGTFETAARGVIYEHRPASLPAERLASALKPVLAEAGRGAGSAFERDAAVVLRHLGEAAQDIGALDPGNRRAFLELLGRVITKSSGAGAPGAGDETGPPATSRLIVP